MSSPGRTPRNVASSPQVDVQERARSAENQVVPAHPATPPHVLEPAHALWEQVDRFLRARVDRVEGLARHGLGPLAADRLARDGRPVPKELAHQQARARLLALTAPLLVSRVRGAVDQPLIVFKGPEVAVRYPGSARLFGDIDLLVADAAAAQRALVAAGFVEEPDPEGLWVGIHHLPRIRWPDIPLQLEVHTHPKWPDGLVPPPTEELFAAAVPARIGVPGVLAPDPAHHALLVAAHAWAHKPLANVRDLLDAGAVAAEADARELAQTASDWGVERLWRTTDEALTAILTESRTTPLRVWAGHVGALRAQTVLEQHLERIASPFWGLPAGRAARASLRALGAELRPAFDEGWGEKMRRTSQAFRRPNMAVPAHEELLGDAARRGRRRNPPAGNEGTALD
jgi:hypothetical protein